MDLMLEDVNLPNYIEKVFISKQFKKFNTCSFIFATSSSWTRQFMLDMWFFWMTTLLFPLWLWWAFFVFLRENREREFGEILGALWFSPDGELRYPSTPSTLTTHPFTTAMTNSWLPTSRPKLKILALGPLWPSRCSLLRRIIRLNQLLQGQWWLMGDTLWRFLPLVVLQPIALP